MMFEIVFDLTKEQEKREQAANNLVVLARERAGSELLYKEGVVPEIARLMKIEKNATIRLAMIRTIGGLCPDLLGYDKKQSPIRPRPGE